MPIRHKFDDVKLYVESQGYELLSETYINTKGKLKFRCPNGHEFEKSFHHFKDRNQRCNECSGHKRYTIDDVRQIFKSDGYELLESVYLNIGTPLTVRCPNGHISKKILNNHLRGANCYFCETYGRKKTIDEVKRYASDYNYEVLSDEYVNKEEKLIFKCPEGHNFEMPWNNFRNKQRCPKCHKSSRGENLVRYILDNILPADIGYVEQKRIYFPNSKEYYIYDFYLKLSNCQIFIEYDGLQHYEFKKYFHKDKETFEKKKKRDMDKDDYANQNGIMIRLNEYMSYYEIYETLIEKLASFVYLKNKNINLTDAEFYTKDNFTMKEIAEYYLKHTLNDTINQFGISDNRIYSYFKNVFGTSKTKYKSTGAKIVTK